jgi:hypothetical protein
LACVKPCRTATHPCAPVTTQLVKVRMQLQTAHPSSPEFLRPSAMVRHILRTEGLAGLYRGITVTILRDIPSVRPWSALAAQPVHGLHQTAALELSPKSGKHSPKLAYFNMADGASQLPVAVRCLLWHVPLSGSALGGAGATPGGCPAAHAHLSWRHSRVGAHRHALRCPLVRSPPVCLLAASS